MGRREIREHIFKLLFISEFYSPEEMETQMELYLGGLQEISETDRQYIEGKTRQILSRIVKIDEQLNEASVGWKTTRMGRVDLTILRLARFEILYDDEVPVKVAINEAIEIAKKFGGDESYSFVNGILGKLARE
ncbi:MAG: transcription antitermination factor NusB [Lachnospiraceae bacterium]